MCAYTHMYVRVCLYHHSLYLPASDLPSVQQILDALL